MSPTANAASKATLSNDNLPPTPNGIPISLRPCFQEYTLEKLDTERDAFTVIERTLARGDRRELRWLFARYGRERLAEWVRQAGWWRLSRRRFRFWLAYFDIHDYRRNPLGRGAWPHRVILTGKPFLPCCATCWRKLGRCPSPPDPDPKGSENP